MNTETINKIFGKNAPKYLRCELCEKRKPIEKIERITLKGVEWQVCNNCNVMMPVVNGHPCLDDHNITCHREVESIEDCECCLERKALYSNMWDGEDYE